MELRITHLYPSNLNLYGDLGNVICLQRRCEWRGIDVVIHNLEIGMKAEKGATDIYFMGGGQDNDQIKVVDDFHNLKYEAIKSDTESGTVFLGVCGGYQLMGMKFLMGDGKLTKGLGVIDVETRAPGNEVKQRCIGNLIAQISDETLFDMKSIYKQNDQTADKQNDDFAVISDQNNFSIPNTLVGFENHSGQTYLLSEKVKPLAYTIKGFGNNHEAVAEGARYKNVFGSYMHGSLLPKNPHFADYLIYLALKNKYKKEFAGLDRLDDSIELLAHRNIISKYS